MNKITSLFCPRLAGKARKCLGKLMLAVALLGLLSAFAAPKAQAGGTSSFEIGATTGTNAVLVTNLPGSTLYNVVLTSGAQGDYVVCWDTSGITGGTFDGTNDGVASSGKRVAFAIVNTATYTSVQDPPAGEPDNLNMVYGIVCKKSAAGARAMVRYNPGN